MSRTRCEQAVAVLAVALVALLTSAQAGVAQLLPLPLPGGTSTSSSTVSGEATALRATVLGTTTTLASTGSLGNGGADVLGADAVDGSIPSLGSAEVPRAATGGEGDPVDAIRSDASLGNLALTIAGIGITADFVMAQAWATVGGGSAGQSSVAGLVANGTPIVPSGIPNETISVGPVTLVLNEVQQTATGITVNALHITTLDGLVDVIVASATAGIQ